MITLLPVCRRSGRDPTSLKRAEVQLLSLATSAIGAEAYDVFFANHQSAAVDDVEYQASSTTAGECHDENTDARRGSES